MSMANILNNQEIIQALAEGLIELSKENSVSVPLNKTNYKTPNLNKFLVCIYCFLPVYPSGTQFLRESASVYEKKPLRDSEPKMY